MRSVRQEERQRDGDCPSASAGGGSTTSQFYQYDHRGNVVAVTDSSGDIQYGYQYDAFGNIMFSFDEGAAAAPTDDVLFTGKDLDPDTGLYYFNARWYDPELGRFVTRAAKTPDEEHPYGPGVSGLPSASNPISSVDVTGEKWWKIVGRIILGSTITLATAMWIAKEQAKAGLNALTQTALTCCKSQNDPNTAGSNMYPHYTPRPINPGPDCSVTCKTALELWDKGDIEGANIWIRYWNAWCADPTNPESKIGQIHE